MITVYSKSDCHQCDATKRWLAFHRLDYTEIDVETDPKSANRLQEQGFRELPVIVTAANAWSGFRIDKLLALLPGG